MSYSSCLMDMQGSDEPANRARQAVWCVFDAIEAAGPAGADVTSLAASTRYDGALLELVLRDLKNFGMASSTAQMRYRVTSIGATARSLAAY